MKLRGQTSVPGDKTISHSALIISSISRGRSVIRGLNEGTDCYCTLRCLESLGVSAVKNGEQWEIEGLDFQLKKSDEVLFCGNSGATLRLLAGVLAGQNFLSFLDGDRSLRSRPMAPIVEPLRLMGADVFGAAGSNLAPLSIRGGTLQGICYELPMANEQIKGAILLAALQAQGSSVLLEPMGSRDHLERMLKHSGAQLRMEPDRIQLTGGKTLTGRTFEIPGDLSAASFLIGAAIVLPGSKLEIKNVGLNPTRSGFLDVLGQMGALIEIRDLQECAGEPCGTIVVHSADLRGATVEGALIPRLIDEIPVLAVLASQAQGRTVIRDAQELRKKESDRLTNLVLELARMGARVKELSNGLEIVGPTPLTNVQPQSYGDHRLALAWEVASLLSGAEGGREGESLVDSSFPGFYKTWKKLIVR